VGVDYIKDRREGNEDEERYSDGEVIEKVR
jgi:hypothetical protein